MLRRLSARLKQAVLIGALGAGCRLRLSLLTDMAGEKLFRTVCATRVFVFRLAEELSKFLIAFLLGIFDIGGHGFRALQQVVSGADQVVGDISGSRIALAIRVCIAGHDVPSLNVGSLRGGYTWGTCAPF